MEKEKAIREEKARIAAKAARLEELKQLEVNKGREMKRLEMQTIKDLNNKWMKENHRIKVPDKIL